MTTTVEPIRIANPLLRLKSGAFAIDERRLGAMLYDEPDPLVNWDNIQDMTCFANSGLQPTNGKQVRARPFPPASPPGAD